MAFCKKIIETERLSIRQLVPGDVSERYLSWMRDEQAKKYITAAENTFQLNDLRDYIEVRLGREDVWFCAIFDKVRNLHIGNIKYEPIVPSLKSAVMGVLIGDPDYRGQGIFEEAFVPTAQYLNTCCDIDAIYLGVDVRNLAAVKAYRAVGFIPTSLTDEQRLLLGGVTMKCCTSIKLA
jgi:ribosomal-protein-alanine N-acetyltransferase